MFENFKYKILSSATFATWLSFFTKSLNFVLIIPLLLKTLDALEITIWYSFIAIINILSTLDSGFGSTFARAISYYNVNNETISFNNFSKKEVYLANLEILLKKYFMRISIFVLILVCLFSLYLGFNRMQYFFKLPFIISMLLMPIIAFGNIYVTILSGLNEIVELRKWESLINIFVTISNFLIFIFWPQVSYLILCFQFWAIINLLKNYFLVKKLFRFSLKKSYSFEVQKEIKNKFFNEAVKSSIGVFSSMGLFYFISLWYTHHFNYDQKLLASYLFSFNIIQSIKSFSQAPFYSKIPKLNMLFASGKYLEFLYVSKRGILFSLITYLIPVIFICIFGEQLFSLFDSQIEFPNVKIWIVLGIGFLIERFGAMHLQIYSSSNHIVWHKLNFLTALIVLFFTYIFLTNLSIYSFPFSIIIGYGLFYTPVSFLLSRKIRLIMKSELNS